MRTLLAAVAVAGLGLAPAAEPTVRDLTLDIELLPARFDFELESDEVSASNDDSFDQAYGFAIGGRYGYGWAGSPHTVVGGVQGTLGLYEYDPSSSSYTTYGVRLTLGYGYGISDDWTVLGEVLGEFGIAEFEFGSSAALDGFAAEGGYYRFGFETRVVYEISDRWLANAHLGYLIGTSDLSGGGREVTIDHSGPLFGLGASYRFGADPKRLE
jgi:hypothetical protein